MEEPEEEKPQDALSLAYDLDAGKVDYRPYKAAVLDVMARDGRLPEGGGTVHPTVKDWHKAVLLTRKRARAKRYRQGDAGRAARARYKKSVKGKEAKKRYRQSVAGKAAKNASRSRQRERERVREEPQFIDA